MSNKPVIGLTSTRFLLNGELLSGLVKNALNQDYSDAVENSGGIPVIIPSIHTTDTLKKYLEICDGFIVTGGKDVHPLLYNASPTDKCETFDYEVDALQIKLIELAIEANKPVLGICRGAQLINITLGGTLYQDISTEINNADGHKFTFLKSDKVHEIKVAKETKLGSLFGGNIFVNSIHHQAINKLGKGLMVSAQANDGIVEGIELSNHKFVMGVQWHPEMMLSKSDTMKCLFDDFILSSKN